MPGSLFTDTDSIAYEIQTEEFYKDITLHIQEKFNTSNYPAHHPLGVPTGVNKEIIGMFKDVVEKYVWIRRSSNKIICLQNGWWKNSKRAKWVQKTVIKIIACKQNITFDNYKRCVDTKQEMYQSMNIVRSYRH